MRFRVMTFVLLSALLLTGCNLGSSDDDDEPTSTPIATLDSGERPTVLITSPDDGSEVVANEPVLIEVSTTGNAESVELFVDGSSVQEVRISDSTTSSSRSVLNFTPRESGDADLRVLAYRGNQTSDPDEITIQVRQEQAQVTATSSGPIIDPTDPTCRALINTNLNFRRAPNIDAEVIRVLAAGEVLPIIGRLSDNTWLQLRSTTTTSIGWVSASFITRYGNCTGIVVVNPPATATPIRTNTPIPSSTPIPPTSTSEPSSTPVPLPNLIVDDIDGPAEVTIPSGQSSVTVRYDVIVKNIGGPVNSQFETIGRLLPSGGDEFDFGVVGSLGINQSISLDGDVTFTEAGSFLIQVTVDSDDDVDESSEVNNSGTFNVTVVNE